MKTASRATTFSDHARMVYERIDVPDGYRSNTANLARARSPTSPLLPADAPAAGVRVERTAQSGLRDPGKCYVDVKLPSPLQLPT